MPLVFTYNGLGFAYAKTLSFSMEQEYDPTNTDAIRNHYKIRVRGYLTDTSLLFPTQITGNYLAVLKAHLLAPRKALLYNIGTAQQISIPTPPDAKLGPIPKSCSVTEVNSGMFLVDFDVECWTVDCDNDCEARNPVISLRWTQTESFDQNWNSNLKTKGLLIVRSDLLQCADNFRPQTVPPLLPDYQRMSSTYTLSPDGLELEFEYNDQEVDRLPPDPATEAKGSYSVTISKPGSIRHGTVDLSLKGPKGTSRRTLLIRAIDMAYSKLQADTLVNAKAPIWSGQFDEDLFEPKVRVRMTAMMSPIGTKNLTASILGAAGAIAFGVLGESPPPSVMPSVGTQTRGLQSNRTGLTLPDRKRLAGLLVAAFRDPCACLEAEVTLTGTRDPTQFPPPSLSSPSPTPVNPVPRALISVGAISQNSGTPSVADLAPYDHYQIEISTHMTTGVVQLPGTGVGPNGGISKVVSFAGPKMQVSTSWVAERTGKPPQLPTFFAQNSNLVAIDGNIVASDVTPSPDGSDLVFRLAGYYVHAVIDPARYQIAPGVAPFYGPDVQQGALDAAKYWTDNPLWLQEAAAPIGEQPLYPGGVQPGIPPQQPSTYPNQNVPTGSGGTGQPQNGQGAGGNTGQFFVQQVGP